MSLNITYRSVTSVITITVMLWNIVGWLGFGLVLEHSHQKNNEGNHCEVTFCYCEVEEGETTCTCHHNDMNSHDDHSGNENEICYYSASHSDSTTASQALIVIAKFNALYLHSESLSIPIDAYDFQTEQETHLLSGTVCDLLRPPQV